MSFKTSSIKYVPFNQQIWQLVNNIGGHKIPFYCLLFTWHHVPEADRAESDEGVVEAVVEVPGPLVIVLQRRENSRRDEHQDRGEEENEHDCLHDDYNHLGPVLGALPPAQSLPEFLLVLLELNKQQIHQ